MAENEALKSDIAKLKSAKTKPKTAKRAKTSS